MQVHSAAEKHLANYTAWLFSSRVLQLEHLPEELKPVIINIRDVLLDGIEKETLLIPAGQVSGAVLQQAGRVRA